VEPLLCEVRRRDAEITDPMVVDAIPRHVERGKGAALGVRVALVVVLVLAGAAAGLAVAYAISPFPASPDPSPSRPGRRRSTPLDACSLVGAASALQSSPPGGEP
jgi:hypothetical protein